MQLQSATLDLAVRGDHSASSDISKETVTLLRGVISITDDFPNVLNAMNQVREA